VVLQFPDLNLVGYLFYCGGSLKALKGKLFGTINSGFLSDDLDKHY
jgi:hypothetical protein